MNNKEIIFVAKNDAELVDTILGEPKPDQVTVKMAVSTISSGTERAMLTGNENCSIYDKPAPAKFPRQSGYSSSGTIVALGSDVKGLSVGDRVAMSWSSHRQYLNIPANRVTKIVDDSISFEEAALWHIATFPLAAIRKCHLEIGESAIVMGLGVLGRFAVELLRAAGAVPVIAVDPVKEKREQALSFGADYAFDPFDSDFVQKVKEVTHGGANVAIEATGNGTALNQVLDCMARFGRVALLGCTRNSDFTIDYYRKVHGPGITLVGAHTKARPIAESSNGWWTDADDRNAVMRLTEFGRLHLGQMIEETHSPIEAHEIYTRLATEKSSPLVQFDWRML